MVKDQSRSIKIKKRNKIMKINDDGFFYNICVVSQRQRRGKVMRACTECSYT